MPRLKLTDITVNSLKPPASGQQIYWDQSLRGFGLRVSLGGAKTWVAKPRDGRLRSLARYPAVSLRDARDAARLALATPPSPFVPISLRRALDIFHETCAVRLRPRTQYDYKRALEKHLAPLLKRQVREITTDQVMRIVDSLSATPSEQLHLFNTAVTFLRFCISRRLISYSPLFGVKAPCVPLFRARILTDDELRTVWQAACDEPHPFGPLVQLCILTAQRRGEIGQLRWEYIKGSTVEMPASVMKKKRPHAYPLGPMVLKVLERIPPSTGFLFEGREYKRSLANDPQRSFQGYSRGMDNFRKTIPGIEHFVLHDLRRTARTLHARIGTRREIAERLISHLGFMSDVERIYDRHTYAVEMEQAVLNYEAALRDIVG